MFKVECSRQIHAHERDLTLWTLRVQVLRDISGPTTAATCSALCTLGLFIGTRDVKLVAGTHVRDSEGFREGSVPRVWIYLEGWAWDKRWYKEYHRLSCIIGQQQ